MKGWYLTESHKIEEKEIEEKNSSVLDLIKVRVTKSLITQSDILRYNGATKAENVILGSFGVGVVSEVQNNLFGLSKGDHVYIDSTFECGECFNCKSNKPKSCENMLIAGENTNGFLSDFVTVPASKVFPFPQSITENNALFVGYVSLATTIIDKLDIQKGEYVAIIGANNLGNILAQLLIYYQAVPIIASNNDEDLEIAQKSGIYYCLNSSLNWEKEVSDITSTHMADKVIFIGGNDIPITKAFSLAPSSGKVAIVGDEYKSNFSISQALKKQLNIYCIKTSYGNTSSSINLIANKAINFSHLKNDECSYQDVPETFEKLNIELNNGNKINDTIVKML